MLIQLNQIMEFEESNVSKTDLLSNLTFVITATLSKPLDYFKDLIERNGGKVSSSVSKIQIIY